MFTFVAAVALLASSALAAPFDYYTTTNATPTTTQVPSSTVKLTGVTHSVVAGAGGALRFDPDNVVAEVGDIVEWHFLALNHSVAESSFSKPCEPFQGKADSFFSGFVFQPEPGKQSDKVFQIVVKDKNPIWYYCAQSGPGGNPVGHCSSGMTGVINQRFDSPATLAAHRKLAANKATVVPPKEQGYPGLIPNPFPDRGF